MTNQPNDKCKEFGGSTLDCPHFQNGTCHTCEEQKPAKPSPGSDAARQQGCKCPVMDNGRGRGYMGMPGIFVMRQDCPLHGGKLK